MLIHAGDVSKRGHKSEIQDFLVWFSIQPQLYKIFIAGNHDFFFEETSEAEINKIIPENIIYLNDSGITIEGIKIWGSPVQPRFFDWAFNRDRGEDILKHWNLIPDDTDILITHGPPYGILDLTNRGLRVGCEELRKKVDLIRPKYHIFGHIHESNGIENKENTIFINASVLDLRYRPVFNPTVFEI